MRVRICVYHRRDKWDRVIITNICAGVHIGYVMICASFSADI
jgi:hypothetical protein